MKIVIRKIIQNFVEFAILIGEIYNITGKT
jgi:hypothetical protein